MNPPETTRLRFREMADSDLDNMAAMLGDPAVMKFYPAPKWAITSGPTFKGRATPARPRPPAATTPAASGEIHLVAIIHPENTASRRVAEKIGMSFELTATDGGQERSVFGVDLAPA